MTEHSPYLLEVENLKTYLPLEEGLLKAVDGVSFQVRRGKTLGLVGESGCGKSMTALSIMRIAPSFAQISGRVTLYWRNGWSVDLVQLDPHGAEMRSVRGGEIAMIFQEPIPSFSPLHTIGNQIIEAIRLHRTPNKKEAREIAIDMLGRVGMSNPQQRMVEYPQQLSGGMCQRAMIAMALSCKPALLIADEPTTALDVTIQAQVLRLMRDLQAEFGMAILYITHDLGVIAHMVDEVAVMYLGEIVEHADVDTLFYSPKHPYTQALLKSVTRIGKKSEKRLETIRGTVPIPINKPAGCSFYARCPVAIDGLCNRERPALVEVEASHKAACFLYADVVDAISAREPQSVQHGQS
jgi:peptide/nickel transport system ATP-binding protein